MSLDLASGQVERHDCKATPASGSCLRSRSLGDSAGAPAWSEWSNVDGPLVSCHTASWRGP